MGDFVEIDGVYGEVYDINWRSVSVKNPHTDSLYIFPNSIAAGKTILNFSEPSGRFKYYVTFVADPTSPPEKVLRVIAKELEYSRYVRRFPKPDLNILGYTDLGYEVRVRFFFDGDDPWWDAQNEVCMAIWGAMKKHNLRLGIKRYHMGYTDIEWLVIDNELKEKFSAENVYRQIKELDVFTALNEEQLHTFAKNATVEDYQPPSCLYKPEDSSDSFYLILEGEVNIYSPQNGHEVCIETCVEGQLFGLTGLLANHLRKNIAQAKTYCVVVRFDNELLSSLFASNQEFFSFLTNEVESKKSLRHQNRNEQLIALNINKMNVHNHHIKSELKKYLDHVLPTSWFTHVGNHIIAKASHEVLLNAIMASCAVVCHQRTTANTIDDDYIKAIYNDFNLIKFMDVEHGLVRFHYYLKLLNEDQLEGEKETFSDILLVKKSKAKSHIVLAICQGLDLHSEAEETVVNKIASLLEISNEAEHLITAMNEHRKN
jgi:CRP-like cAMP-binding protein